MERMTLYTRHVGKEFQQFKQIIEEFHQNNNNEKSIIFNTYHSRIYMLNKPALDQHDAEIRADERKKDDEYIENRLLTYKNRISFLEEQNKMLLSYVTKLFNSQNTITTTILCDLQQKLAELITPNKKGEKDE